MLFILLIHVCTCFWVFIGNLEDSPENWYYQKVYQNYSDADLYIAAFYFVVTTIATVGYGDITSNTSYEKLFTIVMMLIGVTSFSFATSFLASLL